MATIAIIGGGISGLGAAYLLQARHAITVYEKAAAVGGHTRTLRIRHGGRDIAVDTGFIVFNHRNYPNLTRLFDYLQVPTQKSAMSFAVTDDAGALEWGAESLNAVFGQRRNLLRPAFYRSLADVLRFNRRARAAADARPQATLGELLDALRLGDWFRRYYILPMGGAIWSCPLQAMLDFPAKLFVDFFDAHGLLTLTRQPQWYTVSGGSQTYIDRLTASFRQSIRPSCGVRAVTARGGRVQVHDAAGEMREYDHAILAGPADEMRALLDDAGRAARPMLGAFAYQKNRAVLHKDAGLMPRRRRCWASWVYHAADKTQAQGEAQAGPIAVTYWMNHLQGIDESYPLFVTLNPPRPIAEEDIFDSHNFAHPVYTPQAVAARRELRSIQGRDNLWFCGAYQRDGFHEDGLVSAMDVAKQLGAGIPWL